MDSFWEIIYSNLRYSDWSTILNWGWYVFIIDIPRFLVLEIIVLFVTFRKRFLAKDEWQLARKKLMNEFHYPIFVGKEFWLRLTGDENFYATFINTIAGVAVEYDSTKLIQKTVKELAGSEAIKKILES